MNPDLIPSPDMLGIPANPLLVLALSGVTLAAHWIFIGGAFGASFIVLLNSLRGSRDTAASEINLAVLAFLPFTLSMGVTLGIAPLLFVQILYGNFFYTANVLIAGWWLLIIPLLIGNMYLFYIAKNRIRAGKKTGPALPILMIAVFVMLAAILSSNMTLMQTPKAWTSVWRFHGLALFLGDVVVARAIFAILGFLTVGAMFVAFMGKTGLIYDAEAGRQAVRIGLQTSFVTAVLQLIAGVALVLFLPTDQRRALLADGIATVFALVVVAALIAASALLFAARKSLSGSTMTAAAVAYSVGLVALAFAREGLRQAALAPYFKLSNLAINPQWGPFTMFLAFLLIAAAIVVVLLKLARPANGK
jgi:heme/copper-type cytochrome/quinol oxidase subunit 4